MKYLSQALMVHIKMYILVVVGGGGGQDKYSGQIIFKMYCLDMYVSFWSHKDEVVKWKANNDCKERYD